MKNILERLYKRYNQFGVSYSAYTVRNQYTMIQIYKESFLHEVNIEEKIKELEINRLIESANVDQELVYDSKNVQPKSIMLGVYYLELIANSIPATFYERLHYNATSIVEITMAITFYYLGLQTYKFSDMEITDTEKKNILGRTDFYFGLTELQKVRGKTTLKEYNEYLKLFACDINSIKEKDIQGLFMDMGSPFIIRIDEFHEYMLLKLEKIFIESATKDEYSDYTDKKGLKFEDMVYGITKNFVQENYHTLFYYPNKEQKIEVDVLLRNNEDIAVLECKSGTYNPFEINSDDVLRLRIHNKTRKAYKSLKRLLNYLASNQEYCFECESQKITGITTNPVCIHVTMYPMDFVLSNLHALFPEYLEDTGNPILSISFEHLFAMLLDAKRGSKDIFDYWKQRKKDIMEHPGVYFDNNELDLYYEIINSNTMLAELRKQGIIDNLSPNAKIVSSFHNEFGEEERPSSHILMILDQYLMLGIFSKGKSWFSLNKRYLKNLEEYLIMSI